MSNVDISFISYESDETKFCIPQAVGFYSSVPLTSTTVSGLTWTTHRQISEHTLKSAHSVHW